MIAGSGDRIARADARGECQAGLEQFCPNMTLTYNFPDKHLGGVTAD